MNKQIMFAIRTQQMQIEKFRYICQLIPYFLEQNIIPEKFTDKLPQDVTYTPALLDDTIFVYSGMYNEINNIDNSRNIITVPLSKMKVVKISYDENKYKLITCECERNSDTFGLFDNKQNIFMGDYFDNELHDTI